MATVSKVAVSKGVTVSVGKYESVRIDAHLEFSAEAGDDEDALFEAAFSTVDEQVNKQLADLQDVVEPNSVFKTKDAPQGEAPRTRRRRA